MGLPQAFVELLFDLADDIARIGNWFRKNPIAGIGVLFLLVFLGWFVDRWLADSEIFSAFFWESRGPEGIRNLVWAMATVFAGAAGLYGLLLAGRRTAALDRQAQVAHDHRVLAEQGQITDRFTKVVEQLGSENQGVRVGAVYALERLSQDSPRDFNVIVETLAAFVRQTSVNTLGKHDDCVDIGAAVGVLARAIPSHSSFRSPDSPSQLNLSKANLAAVALRSHDLSGFNLTLADFSRCNLSDVSLRSCSLEKAKFTSSTMSNVSFAGADAWDINLEGSLIHSCDFSSAYCWRANFSGATISASRFVESNFEATIFSRSELWEINFDKAELRNAEFKDAYIYAYGTSFNATKISGVNFENAKALKTEMLATARYGELYPPKNLPEGVFAPSPDLDLTREEIPF